MAKKRKNDEAPGQAAQACSSSVDGVTATAALSDNRRKKSAAQRIGRACDRCQHRKLACDPASGGCPPCQKVNAWCTVTDPLTGTPTYRGEFEYLERRVAKQQRDIEDLLARLRALGQDAEYVHEETPEDKRYRAWTAVKAAGDTRPWDRDERQNQPARQTTGPPPVPSPAQAAPMEHGALPDRKMSTSTASKASSRPPDMPEPLAPELYVGLATARGHPVSSRLNMFGWEIDLARFTTPDADNSDRLPSLENPVYDRSYRSGIASIYGTQPRVEEPKLPDKETFLHYAMTMIQVLNTYTPVLHKNKYFAMIYEAYDNPNARPSIARKVMMHMTCAHIYLHMATRNNEETKPQMHALSDQHYHYALGHFGDLLARDSIEDVQALALICLLTRNFPKPEVCWAISYRTFARLIELSYHRAPRKKRRNSEELNMYQVEMQKRLFWVVLICVIVTSGKLGRPMPLRTEDYDVDIPAAIPDDALTEAGVDKNASQTPCEFRPHLELCKLTPVYMDVYTTVYTAKRSKQDYKTFVDRIEAALKRWQDGWPAEYNAANQGNEMDRMSVAFLHFFVYELRLLVHHPSLSAAKGGQPDHDELRVCIGVSHGMLQHVREMQRLRAMEGTWHNCAIFILAIQTTLYCHGLLKDELTAKKLEELKGEMASWLSIMGDMGMLLGSGTNLQSAVQAQIHSGLMQLQLYLQSKILAQKQPQPPKTAQPARAEVKVETPVTPVANHGQPPLLANNAYKTYANTLQAVNGSSNGSSNYHQATPNYRDMSQVYQQMQPPSSYPYPDPSSSYPTNTPSIASSYPNSAYSMNIAHHPHQSASPVADYAPQQQQQQQYANGYYPTYAQQQGQPQAPGDQMVTSWLQYTQTLSQHMGQSPDQPAVTGPTGTAGDPGSGGVADYQPAAASALLQLNAGAGAAGRDEGLGGLSAMGGAGGADGLGAGLGFVNDGMALAGASVPQWPLGFIGERTAYDGRHG